MAGAPPCRNRSRGFHQPRAFVWLHKIQEFSVGWSLVLTILCVAAFRGLMARRRVSFRHFWFRLLFVLFVFVFLIYP